MTKKHKSVVGATEAEKGEYEMSNSRSLALILTALLIVPLAGCVFMAGAAIGGATYAFVKGEGTQTYNEDVLTVYNVALDVVDDMGLSLGSHRVDATSGVIKASRANGDEVNITILRVSGDSCKVKIRIGILGDEGATRLIFSEINRRL